MRIIRMCLPFRWDEPLVDSHSGHSLLPPSLIALLLGRETVYSTGKSVVHAFFDGSGGRGSSSSRTGKRTEQTDRHMGDMLRIIASERGERIDCAQSMELWSMCRHGEIEGRFNQPLPADALPHGLRFLQCSNDFNQPLEVGSIPGTVEVLEFRRDFNQPLEAGHLPASLTHLVFGAYYNQPLPPGVLPSTLRELALGMTFNQPLLPGSLPNGLQV